jgi:small-conductance mechanosensitive channel
MTPLTVTILYLAIMMALIFLSAIVASFQEKGRDRENLVLIGLTLSIIWPIGLVVAIVLAMVHVLISFTHYLHNRTIE